jgi:uncharacterized protein with LGFP repeats
MTALADVHVAAWRAIATDLAVDPNAAIFKRWQALKAAGTAIGVPVGPEVALADGTVAQPFSSGYVLHWTGGDAVECV